MEKQRFALLSSQDMLKLSEHAKNKNTLRSTNTWISAYREWAALRGKKIDIEKYADDVSELDNTLGTFLVKSERKTARSTNRTVFELCKEQSSVTWWRRNAE